MAHGHDHDHGVSAETAVRPLAIALGLILAFMAAEIAAAIVADSLALLSDAAHMLVDAAALGMSVWAARLALRPPQGGMTFGFRRAEILSAQANGLTLLVLGLLIVAGAVRRLVTPPQVHAPLVVATALVGAVVNVAALSQVARANRGNLNVEGSYKHLLTDLYAFAATVVAGGIIWATGFDRADPIAALAIAAIMLRAAYRLLRDSGRVLLEAAPGGMSVEEIGAALAAQPHVASVHDLHVWEIGSGFTALSAHVLVHAGDDCHAVRRQLEAMLEERFVIEHTTLQVEHEREGRLLTIGRARNGA